MNLAVVSETKSVMTISSLDSAHAHFNNQDPDGPPADRAVVTPRELWFDMGTPSEITVTIVPGDGLNNEVVGIQPWCDYAAGGSTHRFGPDDHCLNEGCPVVRP